MSDDAFQAAGDGGQDDIDPAAAIPGLLVRIAGGTLIVAGCFVAATGVQLFAFFEIYYWYIKAWAALMILLGAVSLPIGGFHFQARGWAAFVAGALAPFQALVATAWFFYAIWMTLFSPIIVFACGFSLLSALLVLISVPSALKTSAARAALYRM